jgi:hypothetical protein
MCVPAYDVEGLYRAMEMLALSPGVARQWGERSRGRARHLTPEVGAEKWVQVFKSLLQMHGVGAHEFGCQVAEHVQPFDAVTLIDVACDSARSAWAARIASISSCGRTPSMTARAALNATIPCQGLHSPPAYRLGREADA